MPEPIDTSKLGPIRIDSSAPQIDAMLRVLEHTKANGNPAHYMAGISVGEALAIASKLRAMRDAMVEFVERVDKGEVRSKRTYAKFKEILSL